MAESELFKKIKALPERERAIFVAVTFLDLDEAEIAAANGITTEQLDRIMEQVRVRLGLT